MTVNPEFYEDTHRPIRWLLGLYFVLLVVEGALRKWILPDYSDLIFVCRDPVVLLIYFLAYVKGVFPWRPSVILLWLFGLLSLAFSLDRETPLLVTLFGLRTNYLHLPLVFVMAAVLDRNDVVRYGRWFMILSVPIVLLMLAQFEAKPNDWLNVGAGGIEGGQLTGALGKIRPPGPFSFILGVVLWFSLTAAFVFHGWLKAGSYPLILLVIATLALVTAVPISISRSLLLATLMVAVFTVPAALRNPRRSTRVLMPMMATAAAVAFALDTIYVQAFVTRWDDAVVASGNSFYSSIVARVIEPFQDSVAFLAETPLLGYGVGVGTVAGARLITGKLDFLLSESEMPRIVLELGPLLGVAFIGWRVWLALLLVKKGWDLLMSTRDALPWLLSSAVFFNLLNGQWGSSTNLGFAVFGGGLALAATNGTPEETEPEAPTDDSPEATAGP